MDLERVLREELAAEASRSTGLDSHSKEVVLRRARARRIALFIGGFALATSALLSAAIVMASDPGQRDIGFAFPPGVSSSATPSPAASQGDDCRSIPTSGSRGWYSTPSAIAGLEAFSHELEKITGALPGSPDGLTRGLIGLAADHHTETVYVVVDPSLFPAEGMQARLQRLVDSEFQDKADAFRVRLRASCNSATELRRAETILDGLDWHPAADKVGHIWGLDAYTSTWKVTFDETAPEAAAVAEALVRELGPTVTISWTDGLTAH